MIRTLQVFALYVALSLVCATSFVEAQTASQQKEVAVTIDDIILNGPPLDVKRLRAMTESILAGISKHQIPVVGFVNESLLYVPGETDERIAILKAWSDAGVELANHTFSHLRFKDIPIVEFQDDVIRGETLSRMMMKERGQKLRYFRHPYLQMGTTEEIERSFESFLAERGYQMAPVTVDPMDWMFTVAYSNARKQGDAEMMRRISDEYLKFAGERLDYSEKVAADLFGRQIRHILLLHANELNADNLDGLVKVIKNRGYRFVTLEQALKDAVYTFPEKYTDSSDWLLLWSYSKGKAFTPPRPPDFIQKHYEGK